MDHKPSFFFSNWSLGSFTYLSPFANLFSLSDFLLEVKVKVCGCPRLGFLFFEANACLDIPNLYYKEDIVGVEKVLDA
jgi:hypothetical protein